MALTATLVLTPTTVTTGPNKVNCALTVSNAGAAALAVTSIFPTATPSGANVQSVPVLHGLPPIGQGQTTSVAASGTLLFQWDEVVFAPLLLSGNGLPSSPSSYAYSIGAQCTAADGTTFSPTAQTLTVASSFSSGGSGAID
jgi:hypothetical protein